MTAANRITGKDLYVSFQGTDVSGDFTSVSFEETEDTVDVTAGADLAHYYIPTRKDGTADLEAFYDGSTETVWDKIAVGASGTLIIAPSGTANGEAKYEWTRAIVTSRSLEIPFDDGVKVTATFQFSSAGTESAY